MDWTQLISPGLGLLGIISGGIIAKRKPRTDQHSVVVTDAVAVARQANERAEQVSTRLDGALRRIDELEEGERRRDNLARQHLRWDWRLLRKLHDQGIDHEDPPPLFDDDMIRGA